MDFTPKDNVHGLAYKGLDPRQALFGTSGEHFNLFGEGPEGASNLLGDIGVNKGRKLGISGQVKVFLFCLNMEPLRNENTFRVLFAPE